MKDEESPMRRRQLAYCPTGLFLFNGDLCFRSEYGLDAYVVKSGEYFWGGARSTAKRRVLLVTPVPWPKVEAFTNTLLTVARDAT